MSQRGSLQIMMSVWKALFLREATIRLFGTRAAWAWLLIEPLTHFAFLTYLFVVIRQRTVGGIDIVPWLIIGLIGFFTFRRTASQMGGALDSNRALFTYRQVLPFDAIVVRGILEGLIMLVALLCIALGLSLWGYEVIPEDSLRFMIAMFGLWMLGVGLGFTIAVMGEIANEARQILSMMMMPLYFLSGVIIPIMVVPAQYRWILLLNPLVHGLESARSGFAPFYHAPPEVSLAYLYYWVLGTFTVGLLLYRRFSKLIVTQ